MEIKIEWLYIYGVHIRKSSFGADRRRASTQADSALCNGGPMKSNFHNCGGDLSGLAALGVSQSNVSLILILFFETPRGLINSQFVLLWFLPAVGEELVDSFGRVLSRGSPAWM